MALRRRRRSPTSLTLWVLPLGVLLVVSVLGFTAWSTGSSPTGHAAHDATTHHAAAYPPSHNDFFTNFGAYAARVTCLSNAAGEPDWPWIFTLILLNLGIIAAYLRIYFFWVRSYLAEERRDRNGKLMDLAQVFLWCAICGYASSVVMFFWPAYRLVAICLIFLNLWAWRFVINLSGFRVAFSAQRYQRLAGTDALTGLGNRLHLREQIAARLERRPADGQTFAVLFLDFDRFKLINDTFGHSAGDELLKAIAHRLRACVRDHDLVGSGTTARLGGDEFVVLLDRITDVQAAVAVGERLLRRFHEPFALNGHLLRSTPSIGVALPDAQTTSADQLLRNADIAMYEAKASGKACLRVFDPTMHERVAKRLRIESDLVHAIERNELSVFYQPLIHMESGDLTGYEALVRWRHPTLGMVSPVEFIGVAEETGFVTRLGEWVFDRAVAQLAAWQRDKTLSGSLLMHVNVSPSQLRDPQLVIRLGETVLRHGVEPGQVVIEITESAFVTELEAMRAILDELREAGFIIAMDDFGTGYSSLSALHHLPIQELKIDRSFVSSLSNRPDYAAVIHAIVSLADNLGIRVLAEGVETADQLAELQALGCELAQGYFFSKPLPADEAAAWSSQWCQRRAAS